MTLIFFCLTGVDPSVLDLVAFRQLVNAVYDQPSSRTYETFVDVVFVVFYQKVYLKKFIFLLLFLRTFL